MIPHTPLCTKEVQCCTLGGLASVAGGARNHADWAWLTDSRVAQDGWTPLHFAWGHEAVIKALVEAKADVHAKDKVRGGVLEGRGVGRRRVKILLLLFGVLNLRLWKDQIRKPQTQTHTLYCTYA